MGIFNDIGSIFGELSSAKNEVTKGFTDLGQTVGQPLKDFKEEVVSAKQTVNDGVKDLTSTAHTAVQNTKQDLRDIAGKAKDL